jgi:electron transport complex protein RnfA
LICIGLCFFQASNLKSGDAALAGKDQRSLPFFQLGVLCIAVLVLWIIYTYILSSLSGGFFEYVLLFPLSVLVCRGLEFLGAKLIKQTLPGISAPCLRNFTPQTAYDGLILASSLVAIHLAARFTDALILSLSFTLGTLLAIIILNEIRRRSTLEGVPRHLRGSPLILISAGFLSLIFSSLTGIFFRILGLF